MKCGYHPEREAVGVCVGCGRGICEFCKTILNDKFYCPNCVEKGITEPEKSQKPIISEQATKDGARAQPQNTGISSSSVDIPKKKGPSKAVKIIVGVVVLLLVVGAIVSVAGSGSSESKTLNAAVSFDGTQLTITNEDTYDWHNVDMQLNSGTFDNGFEYKPGIVMMAGQTYTVGCMQFAKGDGTRFNPYTYKAQNIWISCDNDNDGLIDGSGQWSWQ